MASLGSFSDVPSHTTSSRDSFSTIQAGESVTVQKEETHSEVLTGLIQMISNAENCIHNLTKRFFTFNFEDTKIEERTFSRSNFHRSGPFAIFDSICKKLFFCANTLTETKINDLKNEAVNQFGEPIFMIEVEEKKWQETLDAFEKIQKQQRQEEKEDRELDRLLQTPTGKRELQKKSKTEDEASIDVEHETNATLIRLLALVQAKLGFLQKELEKQKEKKEQLNDDFKEATEEYSLILKEEIREIVLKQEALIDEILYRGLSEEELKELKSHDIPQSILDSIPIVENNS